jgi:sulfite reductase (ferredoxin)
VGIKAASNQLRGTIGEDLSDGTPAFSPESQQLLRFHGVYQQDDRDVRTERKRQGLDVDHICMVRVSVPGGTLTAEQYLMLDTLCDAVANGTLRITSRQGIQYHFVRKGDLHSLLATLNDHLVTTLAPAATWSATSCAARRRSPTGSGPTWGLRPRRPAASGLAPRPTTSCGSTVNGR